MPEDNRQPVLRFDRVTVAFNEVEALSNLSFAAFEGSPGSFWAPPAAEKRCCSRPPWIVKPDSGEVYAFRRESDQAQRAAIVRYSQQNRHAVPGGALVDSLNIRENVAYPLLNQRSSTALPSGCFRAAMAARRLMPPEARGNSQRAAHSDDSGPPRRAEAPAREGSGWTSG